jgi:hypothetical protein
MAGKRRRRKRRWRRTSEGEEGKAGVGEHVPIPHEASVELRGWRREGASHKRVITLPSSNSEIKSGFLPRKKKNMQHRVIVCCVNIVVKCVGFYYGGSIYDEAP